MVLEPKDAKRSAMHRIRAGCCGRIVRALVVAACVLIVGAPAAQSQGQTSSLDELVSAVVRIKAFIDPDGRSVSNLGREREGSGIVIDENGLVLTIGYLMVEAHGAEVITNAGRAVPASVVGYDHETGFGLLRALEPLRIKPLAIGKSADVKEKDPELVVSYGGAAMVLPVHVVSRREFTGSWEYLLEGAIFTAPPHPAWSGAALINREGKLVGIGSLVVGDALGGGEGTAGNMFVPIDLLMPILGDLLANGRVSGPGKPWLGVNASEVGGRVVVGRVIPGSPAERSGLKRGDIIVGIDGAVTRTLGEFYRKLWSTGVAGVTVRLDVLQSGDARRVEVPSANRLDHLKLKSTF
jgi:S1-C subfamily serine protease